MPGGRPYRSIIGSGQDNTPIPGFVTRAFVAITLVLLVVPSAATAQRQDSLPGLRTAAFRRDTLRVSLPAPFLGAGRLAPTRVAPAELANSRRNER